METLNFTGPGMGEDKAERLQAKIDKLESYAAETKDLLIAVFRKDKTSAYGYGKGKRDQDRFGNLPDGVGKRWQTPAEMVNSYALEHGFHQELFEHKDNS